MAMIVDIPLFYRAGDTGFTKQPSCPLQSSNSTARYNSGMPAITLEKSNQTLLFAQLEQPKWTVACLCAAWCNVCDAYRADFDALAERHPDKHFIWIDIEDQADLVGDLDVENFPTLLMQHGDTVAFYGTVLPDVRIAERILLSHTAKSSEQLAEEASSSNERQRWQTDANLLRRLAEQG